METTVNVITVAALLLQFGVIMGQQMRINRNSQHFITLEAFLFVMMKTNHLIPPSGAELRREAEKALAKREAERDT